jgi:hypothetical protein
MLGMLLVLGTGVATAGDKPCVVSCAAQCKQQATMCLGGVAFGAKTDKAGCDADAADAHLACDSDALDAKVACLGLCGPALKGCTMEANAAQKACHNQVKADADACRMEVAQTLSDDQASCAADLAACMTACSGTGGGVQ